MSKNFSVLTEDGIEHYEVIPGLDQAIEELLKFVQFIQSINPTLNKDQAGYVASFFLNQYPHFFTNNPHLLNEMHRVSNYVINENIGNE